MSFEKAIYIDSTGGESLTASDLEITFDGTPIVEDSATFSKSGSSITLKEAGHYLVLYNLQFVRTDSATTRRTEVQARLELDGADVVAGRSQSYTRHNNQDLNSLNAGGCVIETTAVNKVLKLIAWRSDVISTRTMTRVGAGCAIQIIKLNEDWDYFRGKRITTDQTGPTSEAWGFPVEYNGQDEYDSDSFTHSTSTNPDEITLKDAGHYIVLASTHYWINSTSDRSEFLQRLLLDGSEIDGTQTSVYIRGNDGCQDGHVTWGGIIQTTSSDQVLTVESRRDDGTAACSIKADSTGITIIKIPVLGSGQVIRLDDASGQDMNAGSLTPVALDTQDE